MKILGITAEYNPFHNGHAYHVQKARELTGVDCAIAVMSGDFTQRGEPACADKWARAEAAVKGGIDAVFELPFVFACNRAQYFASGAVDMLVHMGCSCISFGCEAEDPAELVRLADALESGGVDGKTGTAARLEQKTAEHMKSGISRAKAYETAVEEILGRDAAGLITSPNNILAVEYLKRINFWKSRGMDIKPVPVVRRGSTYDGVADLGEGEFAGASAIRKMQAEGEDISRFMPSDIDFEDRGGMKSRYFTLLKALVTRSSAEELAGIYSIGEGFENKIRKEIVSASDFDSYVSALVSKRYSAAAVKRMLTYVLLGADGSVVDKLTDSEVSHARLLAAGPKGREFMRNFRSEDFEIITNINKTELTGTDLLLHEMDVKAADMYSVLCGRELYGGSDKVRKPAIV